MKTKGLFNVGIPYYIVLYIAHWYVIEDVPNVRQLIKLHTESFSMLTHTPLTPYAHNVFGVYGHRMGLKAEVKTLWYDPYPHTYDFKGYTTYTRIHSMYEYVSIML